MQPLSKPRVLPKVIERYFDTLDFVWELREGVVYAPDWTLEDLAGHESRAAAQLDGLLLAGDYGTRLVLPALAGEEVFAATAATFVLMGTGLPEHADAVLKALESSGEEAREGIRIGLRHSAIEPAVPRLTELAESGESALRAAAADVLAFHRRALPDLQPLLDDDDEGVRARVHCAYGRLWWIHEAAVTERALESDSASARRSALEAAARSALPGLAEICRSAATRSEGPDAQALGFLGVLGQPEDLPILQRGLEDAGLAEAALYGLGALGRVEAIPSLIEAMEDEERAPAAGAAFSRITGIDPDDVRAPAEAAPGGESGVDEEGAGPEAPDEDRVDEPPDPGRARALWSAIEDRFDPAARWQAGLDIGGDGLPMTFNALPLEARRDVYLAARLLHAENVPDLELEQRAVLQLGAA